MNKFYEGEEIGEHSLTVTIKKTELPEGSLFIAKAYVYAGVEPLQAMAPSRNAAMALIYDMIAQTFREQRKSEQNQSNLN